MTDESLIQPQTPADPAPQQAQSLIGGQTEELGEGEYWLSEGVKGTGGIPDWFNAGKYKTVAAQAQAHPELRKKLGGFTGAPEEYALPEGIDREDELTKTWLDAAKKYNMNQEAFDEFYNLISAQTEVNGEISVERELQKLGNDAKGRIARVETFIKNNIKSAEDYEVIQGLVSTADSVMLVEKLIDVLAPARPPIETGIHPNKLSFDEVMEMSRKTDEFGNLLRKVDPSYDKKINDLIKSFG